MWSQLKEQLTSYKLPHLERSKLNLGYYELIHVLVDDQDRPVLYQASANDQASYLAFSQASLVQRMQDGNKPLSKNYFHPRLKIFMLGELVLKLSDPKKIHSIKINPLPLHDPEGEITLAEEIVMIPIFDQITKKYLLSDPEEALALLAVHPDDEKRLGVELVFYSITCKNLPDEKDDRQTLLRKKVEELSFYAPRVPVARGSASLICVLLNLENAMEEAAFIRSYKTLDHHSDIIFVTSSLEILTGELESIAYDGEQIDTVILPLIDWQRKRQGLKATHLWQHSPQYWENMSSGPDDL